MKMQTIPRPLMVTLALLSGTVSPMASLAHAQAQTPYLAQPVTASSNMTTLTAGQFQGLLSSATSTVIAQARAQGIPEEKIAQLQGQLDGLMQQANTVIATQGQNGQIQIPTSALSALSVNAQNVAGAMSAQGAGMQAQFSLPSLPSFLGDGGLDTIISYLVDGLATAVSMIPFIGGPLANIIRSVGSSLSSFLINNALASGVMNAINTAKDWYNQLNTLLGYADLNKLLGMGTDYVTNRFNELLGGNKILTTNPTTPAEIQAAVTTAENATLDSLKADTAQMTNDPYLTATGFKKYTSPLVAVNEISSLIGKVKAAELQNMGMRATGQSLEAQAIGDEIVKSTSETVKSALQQGTIARAGVASATTTLGAMSMQSELLAQANNINAMNANAIVAMGRQQLAATDAVHQDMMAMLNNVITQREENAAVTQQQVKRLSASNIATAQQAAASVASLKNLPKLTQLDPTLHAMPGPYGEDSFLK